MITLNAIEQNTYQHLRTVIGNLPQGSTFQVRDLFHNHLGQPTHPRIARRLWEDVAAGTTIGAAGATVRLQPLARRSCEGYLVV